MINSAKLKPNIFIDKPKIDVFYQFLSLQSCQNLILVSADFVDQKLSEFIASRRFPCKMEKVPCVIKTDHTDQRNNAKKPAVKRGDNLLSAIQKL